MPCGSATGIQAPVIGPTCQDSATFVFFQSEFQNSGCAPAFVSWSDSAPELELRRIL